MMSDAIPSSIEENKFRANFRQDFSGEKILKIPLHCTICDVPMRHQLITSGNLHPLLGVLVCNHCYEFCENALKTSLVYLPLDHVFCLWCTVQHPTRKAKKFNVDPQKRKLNSKSLGTSFWKCKCLRQFCEECIQKHAPETMRTKDNEEWWVCFNCDSRPLWSMRALVNVVLSYNEQLQQTKKVIIHENIPFDCGQEEAASHETNYCIICYESPTRMAFYPCGHLCLCEACSPMYQRDYKSCPKCRQHYKDIVRIYQD